MFHFKCYHVFRQVFVRFNIWHAGVVDMPRTQKFGTGHIPYQDDEIILSLPWFLSVD